MREFATLDLAPGTLVIGDLHLDPASIGADDAFFAFLSAIADRPGLVVLGDLFDAWVGPAHARLSGAARIVAALQAANARGLELFMVPGNRDFLLDASFSRATGAAILPEGFVASASQASRVLFVHGDELCTRDLAYQRLKRVLRAPGVRWLAPRLPDALALALARRLRRASTSAVAAKPAAEKEQQAEAVRALAQAAGATTLVCGHAHRFRDQDLPEGPRWVVLDAFGGERDVLELGENGVWGALASASLIRPVSPRA